MRSEACGTASGCGTSAPAAGVGSLSSWASRASKEHEANKAIIWAERDVGRLLELVLSCWLGFSCAGVYIWHAVVFRSQDPFNEIAALRWGYRSVAVFIGVSRASVEALGRIHVAFVLAFVV